MKEFTEEEIKNLYNRLGLDTVFFGMDSSREDPEDRGRKLFGLIKHTVFETGRGVFLGYNCDTKHLVVFPTLTGNPPHGMIIMADENRWPVNSEKEVEDTLDKMLKDIFFYTKLDNDLEINEALENLN